MVGEGVLRAQKEGLAQAQRPQDPTPADGAVGTSLKEATPGLLRPRGEDSVERRDSGTSHPTCMESMESEETLNTPSISASPRRSLCALALTEVPALRDLLRFPPHQPSVPISENLTVREQPGVWGARGFTGEVVGLH